MITSGDFQRAASVRDELLSDDLSGDLWWSVPAHRFLFPAGSLGVWSACWNQLSNSPLAQLLLAVGVPGSVVLGRVPLSGVSSVMLGVFSPRAGAEDQCRAFRRVRPLRCRTQHDVRLDATVAGRQPVISPTGTVVPDLPVARGSVGAQIGVECVAYDIAL